MVQAPQTALTLAEFLRCAETKPASEYLKGQIIQKPMPQGKHSVLQREMVHRVEQVLKPKRIARAFPELRCTFAGRSIVPDVSVFQWDRIPRDPDGAVANVFPLAPDWTIEILSPDQSSIRVIRNILHCLQHGTELGWLMDPAESIILVYFSDQRVVACEDPNTVLPMPSFAADLTLTIGEIFGWLLD